MNKKVLIITEYFYPYNSTGAPKIITELAEDLKESGIDVEVITSKKNYNEAFKNDLKNEDVYKGIKIKRVWSTIGDKNSKFKRLLSYCTFITSVFFSVIKKKDYDYLIILSSPPIATYIGYLVNKIRKKKFIYIIHDFYPDIAYNLGVINRNSLIAKIMSFSNKKVFQTAETVVAIGRDMKELIETKGCKIEKIRVITNWADSKYIYPVAKDNEFSRANNLENSFNIIYTGNIGRFHDLETLIYTAEKLKGYKDIKFLIIGEGYKKEKIIKMKNDLQLENLTILSYQKSEIYNQVLSSANLLVSSLEEGVEGLAVPSKTYSYFAANKPVIAIMNKNSEIAKVVTENNIGICINKDESEKLKDFILELNKNECLYDEMVEKTKILFDKNYERKIVTNKFRELIEQ